jgi:GH24 family phage-related lysozyme (muramidase)
MPDIPVRIMKSTQELREDLQRRLGFTGRAVDGDIGRNTIGRINDKLDQLDRLKQSRNDPEALSQVVGSVSRLRDFLDTFLDNTVVRLEPETPPAPPVDDDTPEPEPAELNSADLFPGLGTDWTPPANRHMTITQVGFDQIVYFEIGGESYYNKRLQVPTWPGWSSGVTVGIGYDLGYNTDAQIREDWTGVIPDWMVDKFVTVNQYKGSSAKAPAYQLRKEGVKVTLEQAKEVYVKSTLPRFAKITRNAYPGIEKLPPDAQAAILSLVFNRGASMSNTDKRSEMRALRPAVARADLQTMAQLVLRMQRHWSRTSGLFKRRAKESSLIANSDRKYRRDELIVV